MANKKIKDGTITDVAESSAAPLKEKDRVEKTGKVTSVDAGEIQPGIAAGAGGDGNLESSEESG